MKANKRKNIGYGINTSCIFAVGNGRIVGFWLNITLHYIIRAKILKRLCYYLLLKRHFFIVLFADKHPINYLHYELIFIILLPYYLKSLSEFILQKNDVLRHRNNLN